MAKRFTDTDKWKRPWFYGLCDKGRLAWIYMLDECDHRGVFLANYPRMSFDLKEEITEEKLLEWFGEKLQKLDCDKFFIPSFVDFQYGELNPENRAHKSVISFIESLTKEGPSKPLGSPSRGAKDKDKDKEQDKGKDKEKEDQTFFVEKLIPNKISQDQINLAFEEWGRTLKHFGIQKDPRLDGMTLGRLILSRGIKSTLLALAGARQEERSETFDPSKHVSVYRFLKPEIFDKFVNLGLKRTVSVKPTSKALTEQDDHDIVGDPEKIKSLMAGVMKKI